MVFKNGSIKVTDLFAAEDKTVDLDGHAAYLSTTEPKKDFKFHTIADTTFVLNKSVTPVMQTPTPSDTVWQAAIVCRKASWGFVYTVVADGVVIAQGVTPETITLDTSVPAELEQSKNITLMTTDIISCLVKGATTGNCVWVTGYTGGIEAWALSEGITADWYGDVITLTHPTKVIEIQVEDANHGADLFTFGKTIDQYERLPRVCSNGYKVKVSGLDRTIYNDYYVTFEAEDADTTEGIGQGVWKESAGFNVLTEFDPSTMPHILTREGDGSFLLQEIPWVPRTAGDDITNPAPSFVGTEITEILSYQSRLVLITEENVVASATYDHYNLFANTVIEESEADPIDTASSDNQVTNLHHGLVFNASLVLFSDRAQFVHPSDIIFSTSNFGLSSKAKFQNLATCEPVASATSVFFPYQSGIFTGIHEMQIEATTGNLEEYNITNHVDHYIPGVAEQLQSSTDYNMLIVRPDNDPTALYVFQWFNQEGVRKQAAWHKWDFDGTVQHMALLQDKLYLWKQIGSVVSVEYIDLSDSDTNAIDFPVRLDDTVEVVATDYDADYWHIDTSVLTDTRSISFDDLKVIAGENTGIEGRTAVWEEHPTISDVARIPKVAVFPDGNTPSFIIGSSILADGEITNPYVRDRIGQPKTKGKLRLQAMRFNCSNTGALDIIVSKQNSATYTKEFISSIIDNNEFVLDTPPSLLDTEIEVPIRSDSNRCTIKFSSESHLPFYISNIDWSGSYYETGRRTN